MGWRLWNGCSEHNLLLVKGFLENWPSVGTVWWFLTVFRGEPFTGLGCPAGYDQGCFGEGGEEWERRERSELMRWAWGFLNGKGKGVE